MQPPVRSLLALCLLTIPAPGWAADAWAQLRLGMTAEQATSLLGEPLVRSAGCGFEVWIYDQQAEVLFYGPIVGWTSPGTSEAAARSVDVWPKGVRPGVATRPLPHPGSRGGPASRARPRSGDYRLPSYRVH